MSFKDHMRGYTDLRTLYQVDHLDAIRNARYCPPVLVEIDPTSACNQKCVYCYAHERVAGQRWMEDRAFVALPDQLADAGVKAILLQGTGEPLLHRAVPEVVRRAVSRGLSVGVNTNGVALTPELQEDVLKHLFYVKFSVLDHRPERYARLHGCSKKQWEILLENIRGAVKRREDEGLHVALWATQYLDAENFSEAYELVRFAKDCGLDYVVIQEATYSDYSPAGKKPYASSLFSTEAIAAMRAKIAALCDEDFRVKVVFPLINDVMNYAGQTKEAFIPHFCQGPKLYTVICADGEVYPCWRVWGRGKKYSYGSIYEKSFEEIWKGSRRKELDEWINTTPPDGAECMVCNHARLNEIVYRFMQADSPWKDFII